MFLKNVMQGLRSLSLHKLRTFLSALGVLFGVMAVIGMLSIGEGAKQETLSQIEQLGMNTITIRQNDLSEDQMMKAFQMQSFGLNLNDMHLLQMNVPYLKNITAFKVIETSILATNKMISPEILSVSEDFKSIKGLELKEGRFICPIDISQKKQVCVVGDQVAKSMGMYGHVGQLVRIDNVQFEIIGILKNKSWKEGKIAALSARNLNEAVFIPLGLELVLPTIKYSPKTRSLSEIILKIDHSDHLNFAFQVIKRILEKNHLEVQDYQILVPQQLVDQAIRTQQTFNLVLASIAGISLIVGGIGIMNIMLATVSERTHEIGIRRALGANKMHITLQFLTEAVLLTLIGAFLGVLLGVLLSEMISSMAGWTTVVTTWSIIISLGMAVFVGVISGIYPALKAANMDPITALRHK